MKLKTVSLPPKAGELASLHLTKCLYQAALKYYNTRAGDDFHQVKILMLAPTGKAAYNIKGNTIHMHFQYLHVNR
jgi:hypothetical protein